jgi:hypothetical protein
MTDPCLVIRKDGTIYLPANESGGDPIAFLDESDLWALRPGHALPH